MLTAPLIAAAASAGLLGGIHCAGMCGAIARVLSVSEDRARTVIPIVVERVGKRSAGHLIALHAGRMASYAMMGAGVGLLGGAGIQSAPPHAVHVALVLFGNLALIWLGLHIAGYAPSMPLLGKWIMRLNSFLNVPRRHPFAAGMAWGCLPCGLLYAVLPFALLSGEAWSGAVLTLVFGLAAMPYLLFAQWIVSWRDASAVLKRVGALVLILVGMFGLAHVGAADAPNIFCIAAL